MDQQTEKTVVGIVASLIFAGAVFADFTTNSIYEAENAEEMVGVIVEASSPDFLGTGYANFEGPGGSYMKWTRVFSDKGDATLTFRYCNGDSKSHRPTELCINGAPVTIVEWPDTEKSWEVWKTHEFKVTLLRGINTVELRQQTAAGPNIDQLTVTARPIKLKTVPSVVGLSSDDAKISIRAAGLIVGKVTSEYSNTVAAGLVISQSETADSAVPVEIPVDLVVSMGPQTVG